jgi:hypothetical protein
LNAVHCVGSETVVDAIFVEGVVLQGTCRALTVCGSDEYETQPATATSDRQCIEATICGTNEAVLANKTSTSDRVCSNVCQTCTSTQFEKTACQLLGLGAVSFALDSENTSSGAVVLTGSWSTVSTTGFGTVKTLGTSFLSDGDSGKGTMSVLFKVAVQTGGWYRVAMTYDAQFDRAVRVPVTVTHADGQTVVYANERVLEGPYFVLGVFRFNTNGTVLVENRGTNVNTDDNGSFCCYSINVFSLLVLEMIVFLNIFLLIAC